MGSRREKILQKLNPKLLKMTPKLSGDVGSFIDLESKDSLEDGAKNLMMRFLRNQDLCEKNKRNSVQNPTELTVSTEKHLEKNDICELISERLTIPFVRNEEDETLDRPGKKLQKLKMELQEKISAKWEEEYKKRVNESKMYSESRHKHRKKPLDNGDDDDESDSDSNNEKTEVEHDEGEEVTQKDNEENDDDEYEGDEESSVVNSESNNENDFADDKEDEHDNGDDYDYSDACSLVPAYQPGGGMLYGGSELTQCDEGLPQSLILPSLGLSMNESCGSRVSSESPNETISNEVELCPSEETNSLFGKKNKLFSQVQNDSFDLSEAFEFCSGKFPDLEDSKSQLATETPAEENLEGSDIDDGDDEFQTSFGEGPDDDTQPTVENHDRENLKERRNIITFEDSEVEEEREVENDIPSGAAEESPSADPKLVSDDESNTAEGVVKVKKKKTRKTLHFSDEEDAVGDEADGDNVFASEKEGDEEAEDVDECEQRSVHYDSEENEIINPREFFEKEAELSGSEWSGDEDERGLDEFDVEEGDADKLDNDKVRSQLERIHIRRVLDDDAREVRLIQEILFEDGDLHSDGKKRDRKFKWKNLAGTFNEQGTEGEAKEEGDDSSEDGGGAEEEELRKIRHEKELFLMTKKKNGDLSSDEEIMEDFHSIKVTSVKTSVKLAARNENAVENSSGVGDYAKTAKTNNVSNARGSFLTRNEEFLSRLAKSTSSVTDNILGPKSSKNFVFATKSPEKRNPGKDVGCKRQVDKTGSWSGREKRIRLLPPEIETGPSILDLLV